MTRPVGPLIELCFYAPKKEARNFALQRQFLCHGFLKKRDALSGQTGKGRSISVLAAIGTLRSLRKLSGLFGGFGSTQLVCSWIECGGYLSISSVSDVMFFNESRRVIWDNV